MKIYKVLLIILLLGLITGCEKTKPEVEEVEIVIEDKLIDEYIDDFEVSNMISLSITKDHELVYEKFYNSASESFQFNVFSVTKSVTSLLLGIAIDEGYIDSVHDTIDQYIAIEEYELPDEFDEITIHHLMIMSSGILWNSQDLSSEYFGIKSSRDPMEMILSRGVSYEPGSQFNYSDGSAYMMAAIIQNATGKTLLEYAEEKLFEPMNIETYEWKNSMTDVNYGGFDLYLTCEGMQKIGTLVIDKGKYENQQIVSESWIEEATSNFIDTGSGGYNKSYGYYFWLGEVGDVQVISALGHGGQFITIVPELELVITASTIGGVKDNVAYNQFSQIEELIVNTIIPFYMEE